jgi:hypothetical protein
LYESILREGAKIFKRTEVPRIGQRIDIQNLVALAKQIPNQVRADKASSAGHETTHTEPLGDENKQKRTNALSMPI